jgi:membrane protease YdiL (CAAX protease family)
VHALVRIGAPALLAVGAALYLDLRSRRLGLDPPGFRQPGRRFFGLGAIAFALAVGSFAWIGAKPTQPTPAQLSQVPYWQLFALHLLLVAAIVVWFAAGYAGSGERLGTQLGLRPQRPLVEIGVGILFGIGAWVVVIVGAWLAGLIMTALGAQDLVPKSPPTTVAWLAATPVLLRIGLALSAGIVEESFFRGLLQPRGGILFSTALFAMAHLSYGQPFLLVGVTLLSLLYALLVVWRQSLWAAVAAHALFDLVQLLVVVPSLLHSFQGFWAS